MSHFIEYIEKTYNPLAIVVYGSYADDTKNQQSDFDCLIIVDGEGSRHDVPVVDHVQMDLFVYSKEEIISTTDFSKFVQVHDGVIIKDTDDIALRLKQYVLEYIDMHQIKSAQEKLASIAWMHKMVERAKRRDVEGLHRHHWLLADSLEIYFILRDMFYYGPKKSITWLENNHTDAYDMYAKALKTFAMSDLEDWIAYIIKT